MTYFAYATFTIAAILITWRRDVIRDRRTARLTATRRALATGHPTSRNVYDALPELRVMPVDEAAVWAATLHDIEAL